MSIYISVFQGQPFYGAQITSGEPLSSQTLAAAGTLTATAATEIWEITSDGAHTITWLNGTVEQWPAGKTAIRGVTKGAKATVA
jgi:hypothetical protein